MKSEKIYLATSWKNPYYDDYLTRLRWNHFDVYDFRDPKYKFAWSDVHPHSTDLTAIEYRELVQLHAECQRGFNRDYEALVWCDTLVALHPFGKSASWELGWATGAGRKTILHFPGLSSVGEPELMFARSIITTNVEELLIALNA